MANTTENNQESYGMISDVLQKGNFDGHCIFSMISGSWAFNLNIETSDKDYFGVYEATLDNVLSLSPISDTIDRHDPDMAGYEIEKYIRLLAKGNPKVIEPLFSEHNFCYQTPIWKAFKQELKDKVLTKNTVQQYIGFSIAQIYDYLNGKGQDTKKFYHALRLIQESLRMSKGEHPKVWMTGNDRDYLMSVRRGQHKGEDLKAEFDRLKEEVNSNLTANPASLPEELNLQPFSDWLVRCRLRGFANNNNATTENADLPSLESLHQKFDHVPIPPASNTNTDLKHKAEEVLKKFGVAGEILCVVPSGSRLYGIFGESSSFDYVGIYVAPLTQVLSLTQPPTRVDEQGVDSPQKTVFVKGMALFEIKHACELLSSGSFRLLEALFYDEPSSQFQTVPWEQLKQERDKFLTFNVINQIVGVLTGKIKSINNSTSDQEVNKIYFHVFRLLDEAERIMKGGRPQVLSEKQFLSEVLHGKHSKQDLQKLSDSRMKTIEDLKKTSTIPKKMDRTFLSDWLLQVRKRL